MLTLSEAISVWPSLSVSLVISAIVGILFYYPLPGEIIDYSISIYVEETCNLCYEMFCGKSVSHSSLGFIGGTDVKRGPNLPPSTRLEKGLDYRYRRPIRVA
jgi:hypothetical protein